MANTAQLKQVYNEQIAPALQKQFNYGSKMEIPVLKKIVVNQGLGDATQDKKIIEVAINEITAICGQKAVATYSKKDIANFKLRKKMPIGVMVTLRRERMYEFLERLVRVALPRIRDFKGIQTKFDGRGNYNLGIQEQIAPALQKQFNYSSAMQIPVLKKIVVNMGLGDATQDKKIIDVAVNEVSTITGQKAVATYSKKDIANFKLRKKMPIGVMVTLRRERMYEFLEKLVRVALPRIRDFKGIESKLDGRGNYTLGVQEQIIFPEINIDQIDRIQGMNITFVTSAKTDEEGYALLKAFGLPFKNAKKD